MTEAYYTENQKLVRFKRIAWTHNEQQVIRELFLEKGYIVNIVTRLGCDRQPHDALQVQREDVPELIEQCFRQRFHVEAQAEGHGKASLIFVYDNRASEIIDRVNRFQKRRKSQ